MFSDSKGLKTANKILGIEPSTSVLARALKMLCPAIDVKKYISTRCARQTLVEIYNSLLCLENN